MNTTTASSAAAPPEPTATDAFLAGLHEAAHSGNFDEAHHEAARRRHAEQDRRDNERMMAVQPENRSLAVTAAKRVPSVRPRARGAGRPAVKGSSRRSSTRSGDSGSDSDSSEPPPAGRHCECGCGQPLTGLNRDARYLNDTHRKRAQRARDRLEPERVPERRLAQLAANGTPPPVRCKCAPKRELVDEGVCVQCGRPRGIYVVAWRNEAPDLRAHQIVARAPARRNPRYGDRKRKPVTERKAVAA